ncbi:hypothetical protein HG15A2_03700 [Adhaeretor mobilis]|uniref:Uncharacterized protein n=1 Tax=Adhaeretor mobilis TaxID=1930276 RepID=A0A517MQE6_9BACT|nr:hypothetical protein HG15A2_03700 [Adhaeretor mobilis]
MPHSPHDSQPRSILRSRRFWTSSLACLLTAFSLAVAFIVGLVIGSRQNYDRFASNQKARIEEYLIEYPKAYGELTVVRASEGWAFPLGTVPTQADHDRLSKRLHEMFGDELTERMMASVHVE